MSDLTGKTIHAKMRLAVHEYTTAQSSVTDGYNHKVLQAMCTAESFLAKCRDMGIVGKSHGQSKTVTKHCGQRHYALPWHIGSVFNTTRQEVGTRRTDTH